MTTAGTLIFYMNQARYLITGPNLSMLFLYNFVLTEGSARLRNKLSRVLYAPEEAW